MWISRKMYDAMRAELASTRMLADKFHTANTELLKFNARLQADLDWAKHRLTQVERERGQLIHAAIGLKIAVPEFVPTYRPDEALNEDSNPFKGVGEDSTDPEDRFTPTGMEGVDYSRMPGFKQG